MQDENTNKSIQFTVIPIVMSFSTMYRDYMKVFNESNLIAWSCTKAYVESLLNHLAMTSTRAPESRLGLIVESVHERRLKVVRKMEEWTRSERAWWPPQDTKRIPEAANRIRDFKVKQRYRPMQQVSLRIVSY